MCLAAFVAACMMMVPIGKCCSGRTVEQQQHSHLNIIAVRCLLIEPFAESALNEEAGRLLLEDYESFCKRAQLMTKIHAVPNKRPMPLATRQGTGNANAGSTSVSPSKSQSCGSPVMKKAKGQVKASGQASTAAAKRRALNRL
jgi:ubiquitin-conjugating enzyme E2 S